MFRDRDAAVANTLALGWACAGWLGSFALMGAQSAYLNVAGVLLCAHAMVLAAYLIHEAAHQTLFAAPWANAFARGSDEFHRRLRVRVVRAHPPHAHPSSSRPCRSDLLRFQGLVAATAGAAPNFADPGVVLSTCDRGVDARAGHRAAVRRRLAAPASAARGGNARRAAELVDAARPLVVEGVAAVRDSHGIAAARIEFLRCLSPYVRAVLRRCR